MSEVARLTVSVEEAAEMLDIGSTTAWNLVGQHRLPVLRLGRSVRVPIAALERWSVETALASLKNDSDPVPEPHRAAEGGPGRGRRRLRAV